MAAIAAVGMLFPACDLFNNKKEIDLEKHIDDRVAYANAPWVPVNIQSGGLGVTSLVGNYPKLVKKGYSFSLSFIPDEKYPFQGWQARLDDEAVKISAAWQKTETGITETGTDRVLFKPKNDTGTEVEIFVYFLPGKTLVIEPLNGNNPAIQLSVNGGGAGAVSGIRSVKMGFSADIAMQPFEAYKFLKWEAYADGKLLGTDDVEFVEPYLSDTRFTVKTQEYSVVEIRPYCEQRPYVRFAMPDSVVSRTIRNRSIEVHFSHEMDPDSFGVVGTGKFKNITITGAELLGAADETNFVPFFDPPSLNAGSRKVLTIKVKMNNNEPELPGDSYIYVTLEAPIARLVEHNDEVFKVEMKSPHEFHYGVNTTGDTDGPNVGDTIWVQRVDSEKNNMFAKLEKKNSPIYDYLNLDVLRPSMKAVRVAFGAKDEYSDIGGVRIVSVQRLYDLNRNAITPPGSGEELIGSPVDLPVHQIGAGDFTDTGGGTPSVFPADSDPNKAKVLSKYCFEYEPPFQQKESHDGIWKIKFKVLDSVGNETDRTDKAAAITPDTELSVLVGYNYRAPWSVDRIQDTILAFTNGNQIGDTRWYGTNSGNLSCKVDISPFLGEKSTNADHPELPSTSDVLAKWQIVTPGNWTWPNTGFGTAKAFGLSGAQELCGKPLTDVSLVDKSPTAVEVKIQVDGQETVIASKKFGIDKTAPSFDVSGSTWAYCYYSSSSPSGLHRLRFDLKNMQDSGSGISEVRFTFVATSGSKTQVLQSDASRGGKLDSTKAKQDSIVIGSHRSDAVSSPGLNPASFFLYPPGNTAFPNANSGGYMRFEGIDIYYRDARNNLVSMNGGGGRPNVYVYLTDLAGNISSVVTPLDSPGSLPSWSWTW